MLLRSQWKLPPRVDDRLSYRKDRDNLAEIKGIVTSVSFALVLWLFLVTLTKIVFIH